MIGLGVRLMFGPFGKTLLTDGPLISPPLRVETGTKCNDAFWVVPPPIKYSFFRALSRSWCTKARVCQSWAPCIFGCGSGSRDHVAHYFDTCILWTHVSNLIPGFVPEIGVELFGCHYSDEAQVSLQILGVAFATQLYTFKCKFPASDLSRLAKSVWLSKPFYFQCFRKILKLRAPASPAPSRNLSPAPLAERECDSFCHEASASPVCQNSSDVIPVGLVNSSSISQAGCIDASRSRLVDDDWGEVVRAQFTVDCSVGRSFEDFSSVVPDRFDDSELELNDIDVGEL